jgi:hypothetical protein
MAPPAQRGTCSSENPRRSRSATRPGTQTYSNKNKVDSMQIGRNENKNIRYDGCQQLGRWICFVTGRPSYIMALESSELVIVVQIGSFRLIPANGRGLILDCPLEMPEEAMLSRPSCESNNTFTRDDVQPVHPLLLRMEWHFQNKNKSSTSPEHSRIDRHS